MEAMAAGVPVVAMHVRVRELIEDVQTGKKSAIKRTVE